MKYTLLVIGLVTTLSALTQEYQAAKKVRAGAATAQFVRVEGM